MSKSDTIDERVLFRISVLGPLISREKFEHGEVKKIIHELASKPYNIPGSRRTYLSTHTIQRWYNDWKREQFHALSPKPRTDKGETQLSEKIQAALIATKKEKPSRSISTVIQLLEKQGIVGKKELARASVHRFLKQQNLSRRVLEETPSVERRAFVAERACEVWQGDVMHGPRVQTSHGLRKTYLVTLLDDASRFVVHSAFCLSEKAVDIEGVLKQAVLKRNCLPKKLLLDNGAAYRSATLHAICHSLGIRLVYCRPYEPEGKGKLERLHRSIREVFLDEIDMDNVHDLHDFNTRYWAWLDRIYHLSPHEGLAGRTPLERWREDLVHIRSLGLLASKIDDIFYHRIQCSVRKDGTVRLNGKKFEVPYAYSRQKIKLVFDPHTNNAVRAESLDGKDLGAVTVLDVKANCHRKRRRPQVAQPDTPLKPRVNLVELAYQENNQIYELPPLPKALEEK